MKDDISNSGSGNTSFDNSDYDIMTEDVDLVEDHLQGISFLWLNIQI